MKRTVLLPLILLLSITALHALEAGQFRLLSLAGTNKMILISQPIEKIKYILDASTAKITIDGKPAEFQELRRYSIINVKFEIKKSNKDGISIDGTAVEIRILTPEQPKKSSIQLLQ